MKTAVTAGIFVLCLGTLSCTDDDVLVIQNPGDPPSGDLTCTSCPEGTACVEGRCVSSSEACSGNSRVCIDGTLYVCDENEWAYLSICEFGCAETQDACAPTGSAESCVQNARRCAGIDVQECRNGQWVTLETCREACDDTTQTCRITETCKDGSRICLDGRLSSCLSGSWNDGDVCEHGCLADQSGCRACAPGTSRCTDSTLEWCEDGVWRELKTCDAGCDESGTSCALTVSCVEGSTACTSGLLHTCRDGQYDDGVSCPFGCSPDAMSCAQCAEGDVRCADRAVERCELGAWKRETACDMGCLASEARCAECRDGSTQCESGAVSACSQGLWGTSTPCPYGCNDAGTACGEPNQNVPTRYLMSDLHSPVTAYVVTQMKSIAARGTGQNDVVFMKIGDSHYDTSFDGKFMKCFSTADSNAVDLGGRNELQPVITAFQSSKDSFLRNSLAAKGGQSTRYSFLTSVSSAQPTPLAAEMSAMKPRFAFFGHGSNDIGNGSFCHTGTTCPSGFSGYAWALQDYYQQIRHVMTDLVSSGIIPLVSGITPNMRSESKINYLSGAPSLYWEWDNPGHMVLTFNAVTRGNAEAMQVPFFNVYLAVNDLADHGLRSDNIHTSTSGSPCNFTSAGLAYGANQRNLGSIQMLDKAWRTVVNGESAPDKVGIVFVGSGTHTDPVVIDSLPFTHSSDTTSAQNRIGNYAGKCSTASECGGEVYYRLDLKEKKALRVFALSSVKSTVDVDIHVMRGQPQAASCIARSDIMVQGTFAPGTYYFSVDTYCDNGTARPGVYLFGVVECDAGDRNCETVY